ncbi:MAG TPA: N-methyl-L-tryptophan oxidase [Nakamurella sp.]|jgi:sarcosine oxidase|nr:N-methyl-L-tryptophan oxidase [Nakamurella sp.]
MGADVVVVGLGTMGASAACQLAERGLRVVGLDRFTPPHDRGSHAGGSRIIRMAYAEGAGYVPLLRRAYALWSELAERTGERLIVPTGGLMLGPADGAIVGGAAASARIHQLPHEVLDADGVRRRFPAFTPREDEAGLYEEASGMLRPEAAIAASLRLAHWAGADLRFGCQVLGWRAGADGVSVQTTQGEVQADRLVISAGAWAPDLLRDLRVPFTVVRRVQHFWAAPDADHRVGRMPVWIWEYRPGLSAYGLPPAGEARPVDSGETADLPVDPELDGAKAALHHGREPVDPDRAAAPATPAEIADMQRWLADRIPGLAGGYLGGKPCLYTLTPDEHFVLGVHPEHQNVAVAAGFSGHGFKFAPVAGEILADLAQHGTTAHPIEQFDPTRFR